MMTATISTLLKSGKVKTVYGKVAQITPDKVYIWKLEASGSYALKGYSKKLHTITFGTMIELPINKERM